MIKTLQPSKNPFPLESLFPGLHAVRPDIARREAERFLAFGARPRGFDINAPEHCKTMLGCVPFVSFQIAPLPAAIAERLRLLPEEWEELPEGELEAQAIERAVAEHYDLPEKFRATIVEDKEVWISRS